MSNGEPRPISRRDVLKLAGVTAVTSVISAGAVRATDVTGTTDFITGVLAKLLNLSKRKERKTTEYETISLVSAVKTEILPSLPPSVLDIFRNYTQADLAVASEWVGKELADFNSQPGIEDCINRTWDWKSDIEAVAAPLKINPEVVPWIMPLIFVESKGEEKVENKKSSAKGLCQIMPDTLTHLKRYLKLKTEPNLFDGKENIRLGLEYLDYLYEFIPEPSLTLWSYHLGIGNMIKAIGFYYGTDASSIIEDLNKFNTASAAKQKLRDLILPKNGANLNLVKMLTSAQVVDGLKKENALHDNTQVYVPRIAAASTYFPIQG